MTRIRMRKSTLECGIVPQHQITLTLTPSVFPGQKAGSTTTSKPTTAQRQKRAEYATFEPLFKQKSCSAGVQQHPPKKPLLNARLPTMPRSKGPFRRCAIQYACPGYPLCSMRHPIPRVSPSRQKKPPHKRGAAFYKTMRSFNRAWVQPSQAFDQERARREIYSAASSVAGFSALGAAAFFLG